MAKFITVAEWGDSQRLYRQLAQLRVQKMLARGEITRGPDVLVRGKPTATYSLGWDEDKHLNPTQATPSFWTNPFNKKVCI